jgi:hypothetical protein
VSADACRAAVTATAIPRALKDPVDKGTMTAG